MARVTIETVRGVNGTLTAVAEREGSIVRYEVEADRRFSKQVYRFGLFVRMREFIGSRSYSSRIGAGEITEQDVLKMLKEEQR